MQLSMRQIFFCKIDQTQVVWEVEIFYYAKQRNFSSVVLKMDNDQKESVSSAVYKYDANTNSVFF